MSDLARLDELVARGGVLALTGAGCSTASGIPDYRDEHGEWKRTQPVRFLEFARSAEMRRRYWARSLAGWDRIARARPSGAHLALAELERGGSVLHVLTQNVDGLHQAAGSLRVTDLHGRLDRVVCLGCGERTSREALQHELERLNPERAVTVSAFAPDGDADLDEGADLDGFVVPPCARCGGILKPDVVFFGESVPPARVEEAYGVLASARSVLVAGSSLMVWSGYRFVRRAVELGIPVAAVNLGRTRADADLALKVEARCDEVLPLVASRLAA